jgi:hypothetical protein
MTWSIGNKPVSRQKIKINYPYMKRPSKKMKNLLRILVAGVERKTGETVVSVSGHFTNLTEREDEVIKMIRIQAEQLSEICGIPPEKFGTDPDGMRFVKFKDIQKSVIRKYYGKK